MKVFLCRGIICVQMKHFQFICFCITMPYLVFVSANSFYNFILIFFTGSDYEFKMEAKKRILNLLKKRNDNESVQIPEILNPDSLGNSKSFDQSNVTINIDNHVTGSDSNSEQSEIDTWIYPLIQMGPFGIVDDEVAMKSIFRTAEKGEEIFLASGYFNLTDHYLQVILQESQSKYNILMASPEVGFMQWTSISINQS